MTEADVGPSRREVPRDKELLRLAEKWESYPWARREVDYKTVAAELRAALAVTPAPCETCGGNRWINCTHVLHLNEVDKCSGYEPCPTCAVQEVTNG